jgi:hypothetical protein
MHGFLAYFSGIGFLWTFFVLPYPKDAIRIKKILLGLIVLLKKSNLDRTIRKGSYGFFKSKFNYGGV